MQFEQWKLRNQTLYDITGYTAEPDMTWLGLVAEYRMSLMRFMEFLWANSVNYKIQSTQDKLLTEIGLPGLNAVRQMCDLEHLSAFEVWKEYRKAVSTEDIFAMRFGRHYYTFGDDAVRLCGMTDADCGRDDSGNVFFKFKELDIYLSIVTGNNVRLAVIDFQAHASFVSIHLMRLITQINPENISIAELCDQVDAQKGNGYGYTVDQIKRAYNKWNYARKGGDR